MNEPTISIFPREVQHLIISHLDASSLFRLHLTCHQYKRLISTDCQTIWEAHHNERWLLYGKYRPKRFRYEMIEWSKQNGWTAHREMGPELADIEAGKWFEEYVYRRQLEFEAALWLERIQTGPADEIRSDLIKKFIKHGEDVIRLALNDNGAQDNIVIDIKRYLSYEEWRFLNDSGIDANIEDGAMAIVYFFSNYDSKSVYHQLDECADWLKGRLLQRFGPVNLSEMGTPYPIREILIQMGFLFGAKPSNAQDVVENPFYGNRNDYYNPNNSLINEVLRCRTGIPITLAVIYVAIIRRAFGIELDLIGLPGHIVVGVPSCIGTERIFVDPYDTGRILSYEDCRQIVQRYNIAFLDNMVNPISHKAVWQRMVRNLIHAMTSHIMTDMDAREWWTMITPFSCFLEDISQRISNFDELMNTREWIVHSEN